MGVNEEVVYEFPFTYPSRNVTEAMGWRKKKGQHDRFQTKVRWMLQRQGLVKFRGPVKIEIDLWFATKRNYLRDEDNYAPKWLLDQLVKSKIITDDNTKVITEPVSIMFFDREKEERMLVRIVAL